jgi:hypothetical protein
MTLKLLFHFTELLFQTVDPNLTSQCDLRTMVVAQLQSYYTYCHLLQCAADPASQVWLECYASFHGDGCLAAVVACCQTDATS